MIKSQKQNTSRISGILMLAFLVFAYFSPAFVFAQPAENINPERISNPSENDPRLVPCGFDRNGDGQVKDIGDVEEECGFDDLIKLVARVVNFLLILSASVATISFSWAGFLYLTAAGDTGKIQQAHQIFTKVAIGFALMLSAWLIVVLIQKALIPEENQSAFQTLENLNL